MALKATHIFISFTGTLRALEEGRVSAKDLRYGLFYFKCSQKHAHDVDAHSEVDESVYWMLIAALCHAEKESRVQWRKNVLKQKGENIHFGLRENTYGELNELMVKNGLQPIKYHPKDEDKNQDEDEYTYEEVKIRMCQANSHLKVIY